MIHIFISTTAVAQPSAGEKVVFYKVVPIPPDEMLNAGTLEGHLTLLGMAGWHLVGIDHSVYIFSK